MSISTVRSRAKRGVISRRWCEKHAAPNGRPQWLYFVRDLPENSGSPYLVNFLLSSAQASQRNADLAQETLNRVIKHRRDGVAA